MSKSAGTGTGFVAVVKCMCIDSASFVHRLLIGVLRDREPSVPFATLQFFFWTVTLLIIPRGLSDALT